MALFSYIRSLPISNGLLPDQFKIFLQVQHNQFSYMGSEKSDIIVTSPTPHLQDIILPHMADIIRYNYYKTSTVEITYKSNITKNQVPNLIPFIHSDVSLEASF